MLTRLFTSMLFAAVLLGLAGQGVAQASVSTIANTASPSAECMRMMATGEPGKDSGKKDCRYSDCLMALSGCPSMVAPNALPQMERPSYAGDTRRVTSAATTLNGWATAPATSPPKSSI